MEKRWIVEFHDEFDPEFDDLAEGVSAFKEKRSPRWHNA